MYFNSISRLSKYLEISVIILWINVIWELIPLFSNSSSLFCTSSAFFFHSVHLLVLYLQPGSICTQIFNTLHSLPFTHTLHWVHNLESHYGKLSKHLPHSSNRQKDSKTAEGPYRQYPSPSSSLSLHFLSLSRQKHNSKYKIHLHKHLWSNWKTNTSERDRDREGERERSVEMQLSDARQMNCPVSIATLCVSVAPHKQINRDNNNNEDSVARRIIAAGTGWHGHTQGASQHA